MLQVFPLVLGRRSRAGARPLRGELLAIERLEERAHALATSFATNVKPWHARRVFPRLNDNARLLHHAYRLLASDVHHGRPISAAGEWLLDNFHVIAAEIREIRRNLPKKYSRQLPAIISDQYAGYARIHALALELIRHSDSRLDRTQLVRYITAFQRGTPLTIGELWAWPSVLRLSLIENLRRLAEDVIAARELRDRSDAYITSAASLPEDAATPPLPSPFDPMLVVHLLQRLREYGARLAAVRTAIDTHLAVRHLTVEDVAREEHQRQAAAQVSVANAITSLR